MVAVKLKGTVRVKHLEWVGIAQHLGFIVTLEATSSLVKINLGARSLKCQAMVAVVIHYQLWGMFGHLEAEVVLQEAEISHQHLDTSILKATLRASSE